MCQMYATKKEWLKSHSLIFPQYFMVLELTLHPLDRVDDTRNPAQTIQQCRDDYLFPWNIILSEDSLVEHESWEET